MNPEASTPSLGGGAPRAPFGAPISRARSTVASFVMGAQPDFAGRFIITLPAQQLFEVSGRDGAEVKALVLIAAQGLEEIQLVGGFDALCDYFQPQAMRKRKRWRARSKHHPGAS